MNLVKCDEKIDAFRSAMRRGIESFEEAGRILVEILDNDPKARDDLLDQEGMSPDILDIFERIGRKQLFYRLCLNEGPGVKALRNCSYSDQVRYSGEPIDMLLAGQAGEALKVSVWGMTPSQAKQVFNRRRIRNLSEQRAWIESQRQKPRNVIIEKPYTVRRGRIIFHQACELSLQQLSLLMAEAAA